MIPHHEIQRLKRALKAGLMRLSLLAAVCSHQANKRAKFCLWGFLSLFISQTLFSTSVETGRVIGVIDGDTIVILKNGKGEKVRLYGIDCPEKKQDFGTRARQFTSQLVFGKEVSLQIHSIDRYGRTVAEVILPDGRSLNQELVRSGYAWWYEHFAPKDQILKKLESKARQNKLGLWTQPHPVSPWDFRRERKLNKVVLTQSAPLP
jgi:endonuclease YncB( thermonuclease family)